MTIALSCALCLASPATAQVYRFDFQPPSGVLMPGYTAVGANASYNAATGYGFTSKPSEQVDGQSHQWKVFGRVVTLEEGIPSTVLSAATQDGVLPWRQGRVAGSRGAGGAGMNVQSFVLRQGSVGSSVPPVARKRPVRLKR